MTQRHFVAQDPLTHMRKRLVTETEVALLHGLRFPKRQLRIPFMEVGKGTWSPDFAAQFWGEALGIEELHPSAINSRIER